MCCPASCAGYPNCSNEGKLVESIIGGKPLSWWGCRVTPQVAHVVMKFILPRRCGSMTMGSGVYLGTTPDTLRCPGLSYWSADRLSIDFDSVGYPSVVPNLCVDIQSTDNTPPRLRTKVKDYCAAGVSLVWIVDPESRNVIVHREPNRGQILWGDSILSGEDVIPGFECKVSDFFQTLDNEDS